MTKGVTVKNSNNKIAGIPECMQWKKNVHSDNRLKYVGVNIWYVSCFLTYVTPNIIWMDFFSLHTFRNASYFIITIFDFDTSGHIQLLRNTFERLHNGWEGQKKWQKMTGTAWNQRVLTVVTLAFSFLLIFSPSFRLAATSIASLTLKCGDKQSS